MVRILAYFLKRRYVRITQVHRDDGFYYDSDIIGLVGRFREEAPAFVEDSYPVGFHQGFFTLKGTYKEGYFFYAVKFERV